MFDSIAGIFNSVRSNLIVIVRLCLGEILLLIECTAQKSRSLVDIYSHLFFRCENQPWNEEIFEIVGSFLSICLCFCQESCERFFFSFAYKLRLLLFLSAYSLALLVSLIVNKRTKKKEYREFCILFCSSGFCLRRLLRPNACWVQTLFDAIELL